MIIFGCGSKDYPERFGYTLEVGTEKAPPNRAPSPPLTGLGKPLIPQVMVRFLHTSDWQLGMTRHFLEGEAQHRFTQSRIDRVRTVMQVAQDQECSFVVVAGDCFETNQVHRQTIVRTLEALQECAIPVYLLAGNHDPLSEWSVFRTATFQRSCPPHVHVLEPGEIVSPVPGVEVLGAPWTVKKPHADLAWEALNQANFQSGTLRILVAHGGADRLTPHALDPAQIQIQRMEKAIENGDLHYIALGDRHSFTPVGDTGRILYSGAPEPTDFREVDSGTLAVVDLNPESIHVERVRTGTWEFKTLEFELYEPSDVEHLESTLAAVSAKERAILRLKLNGSLNLASHQLLERVLEDGEARFGSLHVWERHSDLALAPDASDLESMALAGYGEQTRDRLLEEASQGDTEAEDALRLLFRLHGRVE